MAISLTYATIEDLADVLGIKKSIPSWDVGNTPTNEAVGTGDDSNTQFFLDHQSIIDDSYTLYANAVAMTETTHYILELDTGEITLTSAGVILLTTNDLTAKYKYIDNGFSNTYLITVLDRAEKEVNSKLNCTFTNGSGTNPSYPSETEIQASEGFFMDSIIASRKPLIDINSTLDGDLNDSDTTIPIATGTGSTFPTSGSIIIGSEVITYTGISTDSLTGCTRGAMDTTAAAHSDEDGIHSTILFRSNTVEGTVVVWTVQPWDTSMFANDTGLFYKYTDADPDSLTKSGVASRIKIIYYYGYNLIPSDITRLTLLFAKRMLIQDNVGKSLIAGRDEFNPEMFNTDFEEMERIINSYIILSMGNT